MPSHKPLKTYEKRTRLQVNNSSKSVDAINALFAQNLTKRLKSRRKAKIKLKELPPRLETYLSDDSFKVEPDNTFDKMRKGKIYNRVKVKSIVKITSSESESSKAHISVSFHSPIMTRRRKKASVVISEPSTDKSQRPEKSSTLNKPVTSSLSIEKENNNKALTATSLSYIKLPKIAEDKVSEDPYKPIFSDTFRERQAVVSSTPCIAVPNQKIVADPISPITKSDSSGSSKLMEKSYDQIRQWDENFPGLDTQNKTPKRKSAGRRRKLSTVSNDDWKLNCQPKVYIKSSDIVPKRKNSKKKEDFRGFSEAEQSSSSKESSQIQLWFDALEKSKRASPRLKCGKVRKSGKARTGRQPGTESRKVTPDSRKVTPDSRKVTPDSRKMAPDTRKATPDSRKVTPNSRKVTRNSRKVTPKPEIGPRRLRSQRLTKGMRKPEFPPKRAASLQVGGKKASPKMKTTPLRRGKRFVTLRRRQPVRSSASSGRKSKMKKELYVNLSKKELYVNLTEDILSEKEVSYSHSSSFDFSSPSKILDKTEELGREEEVLLPKVQSFLTVDLKDFDSFMSSYYAAEESKSRAEVAVPEPSVVSVSSEASPSKDSSPLPTSSTNNRSLQFLISPRKAVAARTPGASKIIILSDIKLGVTRTPVEAVWHDHSYSNSPKPKKSASPLKPPCERNDSGLSDIIESSFDAQPDRHLTKKKMNQKPIKIKPGKSYRRSLSLLKRSSIIVDVKPTVCHRDCVCLKCLFRGKINPEISRRSSQIVPVSKESLSHSILESYAKRSLRYVQQPEEDYVGNLDDSVRSISLNARNSILEESIKAPTAKEVVLRRCGQTEVVPFEECYPRSALQHCQKIGEGVYGEVFLCRNQNGAGTTVMKVIPIEGDLIVNGEQQKKFDDVLSEIVISMELSNLRDNKKNMTTCFAEVHKVRTTQGSYPDRLLDLWELYDETKGSENDSPQIFPPNQNYIVLELANGGNDLESYVFTNAQQAFSMFKQTACALAVAENELKFEHRDLHWGNILISGVDKGKVLRFRLDGKEIEMESLGVEVAIIDFTLSRIEYDGVFIFYDLSRDDELFVAQGDYQFEIYRLMQKSNGNEWKHFEAYTNILWLHYLLDKVAVLRYKNPRTKMHKEYLGKLQKLKEQVLSFNSVVDFVKDKFI